MNNNEETRSKLAKEDIEVCFPREARPNGRKGIGVGECLNHGEYFLDAEDSPCPSCEDEEN